MVVLMLCIVTPTATVFASDGGEQIEAQVEQSLGVKIRNWVYAQAEPLIAGVSASTVIGTILSFVGAIILRKAKRRLSDNTGGISSLTGEIKTLYLATNDILDEVKSLSADIKTDITTLKKLKRDEGIAVVEKQVEDVVVAIEKIATETEKIEPMIEKSIIGRV